MIEIANIQTLRALAYTEAVGASADAKLTAKNLNSFAALEPARTGLPLTTLGDRPALAISQYFEMLGWTIDTGEGIHLTEIGRAVLDAGREQLATDVSDRPVEVLIRPSDTFSYVQLMGEIGKMEDALIVDPYLPSAHLAVLLRFSSVRRVLTVQASVKGETKNLRTSNLALTLGAVEDPPELRFDHSAPRKLHDRLVFPGSGHALMIGASLGASQPTVMVHLSDETTDSLRDYYETIWSSGARVSPADLPFDDTRV